MENNYGGYSAESALHDADEARNGIARFSGSPLWLKLTNSLVVAVFIATALMRWWWLVAITGVIGVVLVVVEARTRRHKGTVSDGKAVLANFAMFFAFYTVMYATLMFLGGSTPPLWVAALCGLACAAAGFGYLQASERYQRRRFEKGDYTHVDLS